jgi:mevalonate kinase
VKKFYSNGKLLLTGEYVVLDEALSLAVPTKHGQSLIVEEIEEQKIIWKSFDEKGGIWFEGEFELINNVMLKQVQHDETSKRLIQILNATKKLNSNFLDSKNGFKITTKLDFPNNWGLGSSSTLINNIAQWAQIDAFELLENTFGGSGYDIACAQHNVPITYQIKNGKPEVNEIEFNPSFKNHLFFVHLNKKQNSREGIKHYHANKEHSKSALIEVDEITKKVIICNDLVDFETLLNSHESIISNITKQAPIKQLLFNDFNGSIKSLGAWGGDFVLVTSKSNPKDYFKSKGFETIIPYKEMVL